MFIACHTVSDGSNKVSVAICVKLCDTNFEACQMLWWKSGEWWCYDGNRTKNRCKQRHVINSRHSRLAWSGNVAKHLNSFVLWAVTSSQWKTTKGECECEAGRGPQCILRHFMSYSDWLVSKRGQRVATITLRDFGPSFLTLTGFCLCFWSLKPYIGHLYSHSGI